jgi:transketolase
MPDTSEKKIEQLNAVAKRIRRHIVKMLCESGSGHPGGSLSAVEILVSVYFHKLNHDPKNPQWPQRDRFLLSKGHAAPVWYATLAEAGYFPVETLLSLRKLGSMLQGHPDMRKTPGVEMSSGSLGQGLSIANGMALAAKIDGGKQRVYILLGDGEVDEGQVWEAAMSAAHFKIDNICAILDNNGLQIDGTNQEIMSTAPLREKWAAFGWNVIPADGHDIGQLIAALDTAETVKGKPTLILAKTVKGKGVSFMENKLEWHGSAPSKQQCEAALKELA